jgi:hypothetical protein
MAQIGWEPEQHRLAMCPQPAIARPVHYDVRNSGHPIVRLVRSFTQQGPDAVVTVKGES